jgi:hypothetical protein
MTPERIRELEKSERKLLALEAGGVDNWDGYDFALESIRAEEEHEEFIDDVVSEILDAISDQVEEPAGQGCGYGIRQLGAERIAEVLKKYKLSKEKK